MKDRVADGRFATKEVQNGGKRHRFEKGHPRYGGRAPGTPNKTTRAVKEWLAALVDEADVQEAIKERIKSGDAVAFFRALDHVIGKPRETIDAQVTAVVKHYVWDEHGK